MFMALIVPTLISADDGNKSWLGVRLQGVELILWVIVPLNVLGDRFGLRNRSQTKFCHPETMDDCSLH
jgi:hypothetical protein